MKDKTIKVWIVIAGDGGVLGEGQGYADHFFTESTAKNWLKTYKDDVKTIGNYYRLIDSWHIVPAEIIIKSAPKKTKRTEV